MKIDYLPNLTDGGKYTGIPSERMVRLFDFGEDEALLFEQALKQAAHADASIKIHELPFVEPGNYELTFVIVKEDANLTQINPNCFVLNVTSEDYNDIIAYIEPFIKGAEGYQWLFMGDIDLLFSPGGTW